MQGLARLRQAGIRHADLAGDVVGFGVLQAHGRVHDQRVDLFRAVRGHFLDVHAAFAGGHQGHLLRDTVHHQRHVQFLLDVSAFFDQQAVDLLAFRTGLVRHQLHAQDVGGVGLDVLDALGHLHAAALAAAACVDLCLDDPHRTAELLSRLQGFFNRESRDAARNRHIVFAQDFLALILMDIHACFLSGRRKGMGKNGETIRLSLFLWADRDGQPEVPLGRWARVSPPDAGASARDAVWDDDAAAPAFGAGW
ncbi:hypothetical protein D3C87_1309460 [compost metagenome]